MSNHDWMAKALCQDYDPEIWFATTGLRKQAARKICKACPVILECQIYILNLCLETDRYQVYGIWGGLTPNQRKDIAVVRKRLAEATDELERLSYGCG